MSKHDAAYIEKFQPKDYVTHAWLTFQAGEIWVADTLEEAREILADTLRGFNIPLEEDKNGDK